MRADPASRSQLECRQLIVAYADHVLSDPVVLVTFPRDSDAVIAESGAFREGPIVLHDSEM